MMREAVAELRFKFVVVALVVVAFVMRTLVSVLDAVE